jgi:hypothetical protein
MDLREFILHSMERSRQLTLNMVKELTPEQLGWHSGPEANSVGFLLFHVFRVEDWYFHTMLSTAGQVWERAGWSRRWHLPIPAGDRRNTGNSWTAQEVAAWQPPPLSELLDYGQAVRSGAVQALRALDLARLEEVVRPDTPLWTVAFVLHQASHHESHHNGQIDYVLGLRKSAAA